jgi:hypothetical protein
MDFEPELLGVLIQSRKNSSHTRRFGTRTLSSRRIPATQWAAHRRWSAVAPIARRPVRRHAPCMPLDLEALETSIDLVASHGDELMDTC